MVESVPHGNIMSIQTNRKVHSNYKQDIQQIIRIFFLSFKNTISISKLLIRKALFLPACEKDPQSLATRRIPAKNFSAVVVVSNCASRSQREEVLSELGRIVPVHVYGKCGHPLPDLGPTNRTTGKNANRLSIFQVTRSRKFSLKFQNFL